MNKNRVLGSQMEMVSGLCIDATVRQWQRVGLQLGRDLFFHT
jgi:hypothetical protein